MRPTAESASAPARSSSAARHAGSTPCRPSCWHRPRSPGALTPWCFHTPASSLVRGGSTRLPSSKLTQSTRLSLGTGSSSSQGRALVGRCPFHADGGRPNLHAFPASQTWWCFRCGIGGDVLKFVMLAEEVSFREAADRLGAAL